jgi:predicted Fe-Mo cluster-binding NifX family protein
MEKIAIAVDENRISAHFGRCPSFTIVDLENREVIHKENIPNPGHRTGFLPEFLAEKGVQIMICGGMGRKAMALFSEKGIKPIIGITGEVNEVIDRYIQGTLQEGDSRCQPGAGKGYGMEKEDHHHE